MAGPDRERKSTRQSCLVFGGENRFSPYAACSNFRPMALHLIKLAVGCESVKDLKARIAERMQTARKKGLPLRHMRCSRMTPKRADELLAGGALYWVVRGEVAAAAKIIAVDPFRDCRWRGRSSAAK